MTEIEEIKKRFLKGTKIVLDRMGDDPRPITPGTKGTVRFVDDIGTVHVAFENGRQLGLIIGEDAFHIVEEKTIENAKEDSDRKRDAFWIYPNEKLIEEIYYNPDSVNGGQFVRNLISFSQILKAEQFAKGDSELFFTYLDTVCRQELIDKDKDPADMEYVLEAILEDPDQLGATKETMDALVASAKASIRREKTAMNRNAYER